MITINELNKIKCNKIKILKPLLILISPFAPHIAEELWNKAGNKKSISYAKYPKYNKKYLIKNEYEYPIMINGKLRTKINFSLKASNTEIEETVKSNELVKKWVKTSDIKKVIIVSNKIINIVA
jgi:leucyl-tRNA synthetase